MRKEIRQSMLVPTRQEPIFIGLSNRANFTNPAVTRIDSTRAHASSGSARSSQSSVYSAQLSTSEREQIVQDDEEEEADECLLAQPQENKEHLIDTMNTSSLSSQQRAYVPPRPIPRKRPTMSQKLSATYNHSKGLAEAERNVPKRRSLLSSDL